MAMAARPTIDDKFSTDDVPKLMTIIKYNPDTYIKRMAVLALGNAPDIEILYAYNFLKKITTPGSGYEEGVYDPKVQEAAKEAMKRLESSPALQERLSQIKKK